MINFLSKLNWRRISTSAFLVFVILTQLQYVFLHTSSLLIRLVEYPISAYIAAFGIEITIIIISFDIGARQGKEESTWHLKGILLFALFSSACANIIEGFLIRTKNDLEAWADVIKLGWVQAGVAFLFTAGIPLLVYALSDTLGLYAAKEVTSVQSAIKKEENQAKAKEKKENLGLSDVKRRQDILKMYQQAYDNSVNPSTQKDMVNDYEKSLPTIQNDIKVLVADGHIEKNGRGYKLVVNNENIQT